MTLYSFEVLLQDPSNKGPQQTTQITRLQQYTVVNSTSSLFFRRMAAQPGLPFRSATFYFFAAAIFVKTRSSRFSFRRLMTLS